MLMLEEITSCVLQMTRFKGKIVKATQLYTIRQKYQFFSLHSSIAQTINIPRDKEGKEMH